MYPQTQSHATWIFTILPAVIRTKNYLEFANILSIDTISGHPTSFLVESRNQVMQHRLIQVIGVISTALYAAFIIWIYAAAPRSFKEVATSAEVTVGTYQVDQEKFDAALRLFRQQQYSAARDEWQRADPAQRDARTQFYVAYAFYREGWGRVYNDTALFKQGLAAIDRAIDSAPSGALTIDDPDLQMHTPAELKTELQRGIEPSLSDFNPLKVFRQRK